MYREPVYCFPYSNILARTSLMKTKLSIFTLLVFFLFVCTPQPSEEQTRTVPSISVADFNQLIKTVQNKPELKHAQFSVFLINEQGKVLADYQSDQSMAPASVMKTITTASALEILGADFKFETKLGYRGKIDADGTLNGDLYIIGGGDPTLGNEDLGGLFTQWASKIKAQGIKKINGKIIGDATAYEPYLIPRTWIWEDIGNYYGSGACGLSIHENLYELYFKPGNVGAQAKVIRMYPEIPGLTFINEMKTGAVGTGDNGYIFGAPFTYKRYLRGTIPAGKPSFKIKGALPDPAKLCAYWLAEALTQAGITSKGHTGVYETAQIPKSKAVTFHTEYSKSLASIVQKTNTKSVNIFAEAILKQIGLKVEDEGSMEAGAEAVERYWAAKKIDMRGYFMEDGSGLSRYNGITTAQTAKILQTITKEKYFEDFYESLAIAGKTGTLKRMCKNTVAQGRVHAKSGSIKRVRCYAGYVETLNKERLTFAIFINNYSGKYRSLTPYYEELMTAMVKLK